MTSDATAYLRNPGQAALSTLARGLDRAQSGMMAAAEMAELLTSTARRHAHAIAEGHAARAEATMAEGQRVMARLQRRKLEGALPWDAAVWMHDAWDAVCRRRRPRPTPPIPSAPPRRF